MLHGRKSMACNLNSLLRPRLIIIYRESVPNFQWDQTDRYVIAPADSQLSHAGAAGPGGMMSLSGGV